MYIYIALQHLRKHNKEGPARYTNTCQTHACVCNVWWPKFVKTTERCARSVRGSISQIRMTNLWSAVPYRLGFSPQPQKTSFTLPHQPCTLEILNLHQPRTGVFA
jgi:hypothetical protein